MIFCIQSVLLAVDFAEKLSPVGTSPSPVARSVMRDMLIVPAVALGIAVLLLVWAVYFRKPRKRPSGRSVTESQAASKSDLVKRGVVEGSSGRRKSRYRRRRREHRSRNPTLAETGGLPPPKSPEGS
jgi:hypothetical protein